MFVCNTSVCVSQVYLRDVLHALVTAIIFQCFFLVLSLLMLHVDQHAYSPSTGLIALLLLGVPGGICFCCRRRICKSCRNNKSHTDTVESNALNAVPVSIPCSNTVTDPVGPGGPGQVK